MVGWDGPGSCGPDDQLCTVLAGRDSKLHPDHRNFAVVILYFRFGQRGALHRAPHDRLGAAHQRTAHRHAQEFADDGGFALEFHGEIGIVPLALDAERAELLRLNVYPFLGKGATGRAELVARNIILSAVLAAELFFHLPFDRQAVTVPARQVGRVMAGHLVRAHDDVLDDLVHRRAEMDVPVRVWRAVMQDPRLGAACFRISAQFLVKLEIVPALDPVRLALGQAAAHREFGGGQEQRVAIIAVGQGISHVGPMAVLACCTEMPGNGHGFFHAFRAWAPGFAAPMIGSARSRAANSNEAYPCHGVSVAGAA